MQPKAGAPSIECLRTFAGRPVCLRLDDTRELHGTLRTELLTDKSISVFLAHPAGGATVYIEDIVGIEEEIVATEPG